MMPEKNEGFITTPLGFHQGNTILYLSQHYGDAFKAILEALQNSIDKHAKHALIEINVPERYIKIFDDGQSASCEEVTAKFRNIAQSNKLADASAIGEKGIGNLAGMTIAEIWQMIAKDFTSKPASIWVHRLEKSELAKRDGISLHSEPFQGKEITNKLHFKPNVMLWLRGVSDIAMARLSNIKLIERSILDAYNPILRTRGVDVRIVYKKDARSTAQEYLVKPVLYRGDLLQSVKEQTPLGEVEFAFYYSAEPHKEHQRVYVLHQGVNTMPLHNFFMRSLLDDDVKNVINRGFFDGEIRLGFCTVNPGKDSFQLDDQCQVFASVVKDFVMGVLKPIIDNFDQSERSDKLNRIALGVLKKIQLLFKENPHLIPPRLRAMSKASVGSVTEEEETSKVSTPGGRKRKLSKTALVDQAATHKKNKASGIPVGKRDKDQVMASKPRPGLQVDFVYPKSEEEQSWHSRISPAGIIEINSGHLDFVRSELVGQNKVSEYLFMLILKELVVVGEDPTTGNSFGNIFERRFMALWKANLPATS